MTTALGNCCATCSALACARRSERRSGLSLGSGLSSIFAAHVLKGIPERSSIIFLYGDPEARISSICCFPGVGLDLTALLSTGYYFMFSLSTEVPEGMLCLPSYALWIL